ncbi:MAG: RICIN domain-containing protein [Desulfobacterales bacterium]|nr:RICIN domain-containing protein [Desulfobacterales bacterium]
MVVTLSIESEQSNWQNNDASLTIREFSPSDTLECPQVWNIIQFRKGAWIMMNQYSGFFASIRGRSTGDNATAIQFHAQYTLPSEPFQEWDFIKLANGNWMIQNVHSQKYIGPENRSTENDHFCIQYSDQTIEDSYQQWVFEEI